MPFTKPLRASSGCRGITGNDRALNIEQAAATSARGQEPGHERLGGHKASAGDKAPSIEVALATYNSARFLPELLDSLFAQTNQEFTLLIADDGSGDDTMAIVESYSGANPGRIRIVGRSKQAHGPAGNFGRLLDVATADYVMLCDHDDVWLPDKITTSLEHIRALEAAHPAETPILVHTDLLIVNADLDVIYPSFFEFSKLQPQLNDLRRLLLSNVASGCTTIVNRALYQRARPVPAEAIMHDHWLALVAAALGTIGCMMKPTILYRLHGGNTIGVRRPGSASAFDRVYHTLFSGERYRTILRYSRQAAALLGRYADQMKDADRRATAALATIPTTSRWRRFLNLRRNGLGLGGFVRDAALLIVVTRGAAGSAEVVDS